jgi:hypothetical protein
MGGGGALLGRAGRQDQGESQQDEDLFHGGPHCWGEHNPRARPRQQGLRGQPEMAAVDGPGHPARVTSGNALKWRGSPSNSSRIA